MTGTLHATDELVAMAWLASIPGFSPSIVGTQTPQKSESWAATGFLVVTGGVGGGLLGDQGALHAPVVQVDAFAVPAGGGGKPPWGRANTLLETIIRAAYDAPARTLTLPAGFPTVRVLDVLPESTPRRVPGEPTPIARYTLDLSFYWAEL